MPSSPSRMAKHPRRFRNFWVLVMCFCAGFVLVKTWYDNARTAIHPYDIISGGHAGKSSQQHNDVVIVVASQSGDNTTWLDGLSDWSKLVYVTDDQSASLTVPVNKGREAMVYLTYIIDNYDSLAEVIFFSHSTRYQWHNDDPLYDGRAVLARTNTSYIKSQGYVNLRCVWTLGCPAEIHPIAEADAPAPDSDPTSDKAKAGSFYKEAFQRLFPDVPVPEEVGASCCAQFAATAERIRERPRSDYQRYRDWLLETPLKDHLSGRILEYSWHIIFGKDPVFCPTASDCYCKLFGLCDLKCEGRGVCRKIYTLPTYSVLPEGWPDIDWDNKWRNSTEMRLAFDRETRQTLE